MTRIREKWQKREQKLSGEKEEEKEKEEEEEKVGSRICRRLSANQKYLELIFFVEYIIQMKNLLLY